jgi:hypothetical protein
MITNKGRTAKHCIGLLRALLVLSAAFVSFFAIAQTNVQATDQTQGFGTLFTEPDEREYMDFLRDELIRNQQLATFNIDEDVIPDIPEEIQTEETAPEIITYKFGGLMTRINGNRMIWLNNNQIPEQDLPGNMSLVTTASGVVLNIRAEGVNYALKAGQSIDLNNGVIREPFEEPETVNSQPLNTVSDDSEADAEAETNTDVEASTQENITVASEENQTVLGAILDQLSPNDEELSDEQLQQALEILTEQER